MQSALDRRQTMLEILNYRRFITIRELMSELNISKRTVIRDIAILTSSAPIETFQGNGGGIRVADGWYLSRRYLTNDQESVLRNLLPGLQPEQQKAISGILTAFAMPKAKGDKK